MANITLCLLGQTSVHLAELIFEVAHVSMIDSARNFRVSGSNFLQIVTFDGQVMNWFLHNHGCRGS